MSDALARLGRWAAIHRDTREVAEDLAKALMEVRLSRVKHRMPAQVAGIVVGWRGGRSGWCATRGQTLIRGCTGWLPSPQDRFSS